MTSAVERHSILIEHGWRCRVDGKWISPDPAEARFAFTFAAAWAQHCDRQEDEAVFLASPEPDPQSANISRDPK
jgi:hypothetical protein